MDPRDTVVAVTVARHEAAAHAQRVRAVRERLERSTGSALAMSIVDASEHTDNVKQAREVLKFFENDVIVNIVERYKNKDTSWAWVDLTRFQADMNAYVIENHDKIVLAWRNTGSVDFKELGRVYVCYPYGYCNGIDLRPVVFNNTLHAMHALMQKLRWLSVNDEHNSGGQHVWRSPVGALTYDEYASIVLRLKQFIERECAAISRASTHIFSSIYNSMSGDKAELEHATAGLRSSCERLQTLVNEMIKLFSEMDTRNQGENLRQQYDPLLDSMSDASSFVSDSAWTSSSAQSILGIRLMLEEAIRSASDDISQYLKLADP